MKPSAQGQAGWHEPVEPVVLRDGTTASLYVAHPRYASELQAFFSRLSPLARHRRFFLESEPPAQLVAEMCQGSDPKKQLTLLVARTVRNLLHILAVGSYEAKDERTVEVAFAVDDDYHGKGLGTILLERLAFLARGHGFTRLWAVTQPDNLPMRQVFLESGFVVRERFGGDEMEVEMDLASPNTETAKSDLRDRVATVASLQPLFHPRSVAVIGASRDPDRIGAQVLAALVSNRFSGSVFPINPHASSLQGLRAYPSITELPEAVDLAIVVVPPAAVLQTVEACGAAGVRALVVITSGFSEVGPAGADLQRALVQKVRDHGMRMVGPNCFGVVNTAPTIRLNATFASTFPPAGRVAMSSQSGALGLALLAAAHRLQLGISSFVSVGNKADISVNDLLQYWENDPASDVILLYVESFGNPRRFARIARRVARTKPIVAVKAGRTQSGRRAAGSHTAALASSETAVEALFEQTGVIRAGTLEEMFALGTLLSNQPLPPGRRVAVLTNAGGPGILCADTCEASGLLLPELSPGVRERLASFAPSAASLSNPVDLIASASADHYRQAIETLLAAPEIDIVIILFVSVSLTKTGPIAAGIQDGIRRARAAGISQKPIAVVWMAEGDLDRRFQLDRETIPTFILPEIPATVLGKAARYAEWRHKSLGQTPELHGLDIAPLRDLCGRVVTDRGPGWLTVEETKAVLTGLGLSVQPGEIAKTEQEAVALAEQLGFPVALKLVSHEIVHKTEVGGVALSLKDKDEVRRTYRHMIQRIKELNKLEAMEAVLIQPMLTNGVEVMVGVTHDPSFGPLVAFGLGGIHVEILEDVEFRVTPLTDRDAHEMVRNIKGYRLLEGYRGHPPADIAAIEDILLRISRLVEEIPEIQELDLNPIFALPPGQGCRIVDARIRVGSFVTHSGS